MVAKHHLGQGAVRQEPGLGFARAQRICHVALGDLDFRIGEIRIHDDVGQQRKNLVELFRQDARAHENRVLPGARRKISTRELELFRDLTCGASLRALRKRFRQHFCEPGTILGISRQSTACRHRERHFRKSFARHQPDRQPVVELKRLHGWSFQGRDRPVRRQILRQRMLFLCMGESNEKQARRDQCAEGLHCLPSFESGVADFAAGTRSMMVRLFFTRYFAANARTSSAVTLFSSSGTE